MNAAGRVYTSKYRGVHQTFPTRRWEAQFRRSGKPTSLGCFDDEEQAAKAYDKMMLWCELHNASGIKGGITNFDPAEYEQDVTWLSSITQVGGWVGGWAGGRVGISDLGGCTFVLLGPVDWVQWLAEVTNAQHRSTHCGCAARRNNGTQT